MSRLCHTITVSDRACAGREVCAGRGPGADWAGVAPRTSDQWHSGGGEPHLDTGTVDCGSSDSTLGSVLLGTCLAAVKAKGTNGI